MLPVVRALRPYTKSSVSPTICCCSFFLVILSLGNMCRLTSYSQVWCFPCGLELCNIQLCIVPLCNVPFFNVPSNFLALVMLRVSAFSFSSQYSHLF